MPSSQMIASQDYQRALELRQMAMTYDDLPKYLLAPEVGALLHYVEEWSQHAFINLLWNTGPRINEALAVCRRDFRLNMTMSHVIYRTAKQRRADPGWPRKGKSVHRIVPLY